MNTKRLNTELSRDSEITATTLKNKKKKKEGNNLFKIAL